MQPDLIFFFVCFPSSCWTDFYEYRTYSLSPTQTPPSPNPWCVRVFVFNSLAPRHVCFRPTLSAPQSVYIGTRFVNAAQFLIHVCHKQPEHEFVVHKMTIVDHFFFKRKTTPYKIYERDLNTTRALLLSSRFTCANAKLRQEWGLFSSCCSSALSEMRRHRVSVIGALLKAARAPIIHTAAGVAYRSSCWIVCLAQFLLFDMPLQFDFAQDAFLCQALEM